MGTNGEKKNFRNCTLAVKKASESAAILTCGCNSCYRTFLDTGNMLSELVPHSFSGKIKFKMLGGLFVCWLVCLFLKRNTSASSKHVFF